MQSASRRPQGPRQRTWRRIIASTALLATGALALLPGLAGTADATAPQETPAIPVRAIDVYRTTAFDAAWVESELGAEIRAVLQDPGTAGDLQTTRDRIRSTIRSRGDFAYLELSPIRYFAEDGPYVYVTVDVVDAADREERLSFREPPTESFDDPAGLLEDWSEYQGRVMALLQAGEVGAGEVDCPAFHCLPGGFEHPDLAPWEEIFESRVPGHWEQLAAILRHDRDPARRAGAAFLLAHGEDADALVELLLDSIRDPSASVRNNAMRVLALMASDGGLDVRIPVAPLLEAIDFPATTDRNKALAILAGVARSRPDLHDRIVERAGQRLLALLRLKQPNNHDFAWQILKTVSGEEHGEWDLAAWESWLAGRTQGDPGARS